MAFTNTGTSPEFPITNEEMREGKYHKISSFDIITVSPPQINDSNSASLAMSKWVQQWPEWTFDKVSFPLYDGVCQFLGTPSNRPDFIKDYHFISLMRTIDLYLSPTYSSFIYMESPGVATTPPPTPVLTGDQNAGG